MFESSHTDTDTHILTFHAINSLLLLSPPMLPTPIRQIAIAQTAATGALAKSALTPKAAGVPAEWRVECGSDKLRHRLESVPEYWLRQPVPTVQRAIASLARRAARE